MLGRSKKQINEKSCELLTVSGGSSWGLYKNKKNEEIPCHIGRRTP